MSMRHINEFNSFSINEATLDTTKININYMLSRPGRAALKKLRDDHELEIYTDDIVLKYSENTPKRDDVVFYIKSSSIVEVPFSYFEDELELSLDNLLIYETTSRNYPWAVAIVGTRTNMVKQHDKSGSSKRGQHFRETAFLITLGIIAWRLKKIKLNIFSHRGQILYDYKPNDAVMSRKLKASFRDEYTEFTKNTNVYNAMVHQCEELIKFLGDSINNVSRVEKNSSLLSINYLAEELFREEIRKAKLLQTSFQIPDKSKLSKWNPSDIWIVYKGYDWLLHNKEDGKEKFDTITDLNDFLANSIISKNGLIGVSLKQSEKVGKVYPVNLGTYDTSKEYSKIKHKFDGYSISNDNKTAMLFYEYEIIDPSGVSNTGEGDIQCRTFDNYSNTINISLEVKGSKKSKHMSGKAGSILEPLMSIPVKGINYHDYKEMVRVNTSKTKIARELSKFEYGDEDLKGVMEYDLQDGRSKTPTQNSRMQSVIVFAWLNALDEPTRDNYISKIIKYAKSESDWSAPHLIAN